MLDMLKVIILENRGRSRGVAANQQYRTFDSGR